MKDTDPLAALRDAIGACSEEVTGLILNHENDPTDYVRRFVRKLVRAQIALEEAFVELKNKIEEVEDQCP